MSHKYIIKSSGEEIFTNMYVYETVFVSFYEEGNIHYINILNFVVKYKNIPLGTLSSGTFTDTMCYIHSHSCIYSTHILEHRKGGSI